VALISADGLVYPLDVRAAVSIVPVSRETLDSVVNASDWRPAGARILPRVDDG
jgi:hypothetical protein